MSKNELNFFEQITNVSHLPLKELVKIRTGVNILASKLAKVANDKYCYPVVSGGKQPLGYWSQASHKEATITISRNGSAGYVSWQEQPFYLNDVAMVFEAYDEKLVDKKYLYHFLKSMQNQLYEMANKSAIPCLRKSELDLIKVPLPPLTTQQAIATTLDQFVHLKDQLITNLNQELALRQKQYQYYLKTLLDFANPEHPFVKNGGGN